LALDTKMENFVLLATHRNYYSNVLQCYLKRD
jgi:hypothetical protein